MAGSVVNYELDDKETQMEHRNNDRETIKLQSNNQKHINPTMLESNNEAKPTESIKRDSIQETSISTESKKPTDTKNKDNIKLDSNGDEIVWQIQYDIPIITNIISWGLRIGWVTLLCYFFSLGLMKYMEQYEQYSKMEWYKQAVIIGLGIVFAILIWNLLIVILQTLNLKTIYATNNNLIIQKYFGKNVVLSLGSFYVVFKTLYRAFETEYAIIRTFDGSTSFIFGIAKNHKNFRAHGIKNIEELERILKPKIEKYLITLEERYFQDFLSFDYQYIHGGSGNIMLLDMENILRLRKETDCGK
ncbi:hypothetical protein [Helicobacter trogontum]|uniref:hypothetical protein n=1 Tax=Helicobacter trogontum TaxID=50960 RepID=UPI00131A46DB|nr:hypothetical protein [Helicobacter trogontum]